MGRECCARSSSRRASAAFSLLEVVMASALCAAALVPALILMRNGIDLAREIDVKHQLLLYGVGTMEEQLASVAALGSAWPGSAPAPGSYAADGQPNMRYLVSWSDSPANGGIAGRLMNVNVTTYYDENGNGALNANEPSIALTTKIGKFTSYENEAGN